MGALNNVGISDIDGLMSDWSHVLAEHSLDATEKLLLVLFISFINRRDDLGTPVGDAWSGICRGEFLGFLGNNGYLLDAQATLFEADPEDLCNRGFPPRTQRVRLSTFQWACIPPQDQQQWNLLFYASDGGDDDTVIACDGGTGADTHPLIEPSPAVAVPAMAVPPLAAPSLALEPASVVALIPVSHTPELLPVAKTPELSMGSPGIASSVAVPQSPALIPVDPMLLFGSDGDVNGPASQQIVSPAVPFIHEDLGVRPNREPVAGKMIVHGNWSGPTDGNHDDALTCDSANVISPSTVASADSATANEYPDLVFTNDDEIAMTKYDEQSVTFGDDDSIVGAVCSTTNCNGDQSSETVSSLFNEVCVDLALFSEELSTLVDEFELDCLEAQSELDSLLGSPQAASGEPNGTPGAVVADIGSGNRAAALVADAGSSAVVDVLSMHLPSLGEELVPHETPENSFDFAVAVVTVNGEVQEAATTGFLMRSDLGNKLVDGKSSLQVLLQLAKLSMHGRCMVAGVKVSVLVEIETWNSSLLVPVTLQQDRLGSEGDVDDSKWRVVGVFHSLSLGGMTASSMVGSGMEAEPKLHRIGGKSVHDIALLCNLLVDAKSCTFAGGGIAGIELSTLTGIDDLWGDC